MDDYPTVPERGSLDTETLPPVDVPQHEWPHHPLLRRARLNIMGDGLEWPDATFEQLPQLREIALVADDGILCARLAARFNFDRFVDSTTPEDGPAQPVGHVPDIQRFYTRVTDNGFHIVGVFSAATIGGRRRYFQWLTGAWVEVGLSGFLYVRDDLDTHFSEVAAARLDDAQPGASTTPVTVDEDWSMERLERTFAPTETAPAPRVDDVVELSSPAAGAPAPLPHPVTEAVSKAMPEAMPEAVSVSEPGSTPTSVQRGIAVALATVIHRGATDFAGAAYIDHPARVAEHFDPELESVRHCAAWLHDVLELSDLTEHDLLEAGVLPEVVDIVSMLTHLDGPTPVDQLALIAGNPDALAVKLAALDDNAAPWRLRRLDGATRARLELEHEQTRAGLGIAR